MVCVCGGRRRRAVVGVRSGVGGVRGRRPGRVGVVVGVRRAGGKCGCAPLWRVGVGVRHYGAKRGCASLWGGKRGSAPRGGASAGVTPWGGNGGGVCLWEVDVGGPPARL